MSLLGRLKPRYSHPDEVRMTLGEHLEELRSRLIRAIVALVVGAIVCYVFVDYIQGFLTWPVFAILRKNDLPARLSYLSPAEAFITDLKIALIVGFIVSAPYSLTQIWGFVAAGLYSHERRWVHRFAPVSIGLFFTGAAFLLIVVAPLLLDFLLSYKTEYPDLGRYLQWLVPGGGAEPIEANESLAVWPTWGDPPQPTSQPALLTFADDPEDPPEGVPWVNLTEREVHIRLGEKIYRMSGLEVVERRNRVQPMMRLQEYIVFVLHLSAAFGIGFQVPVVVAFIAAIGVATAAEMGRLRRYVWFGMAIVAAVITPPDVSSMLFLLGPMALLFEVGLFAARFLERESAVPE